MRLTHLELSGFKSFAKPTVLEFPSAVTAIVGPNGSGKSNIKESIQWALGEQSVKSLRGKKGEDLIWNGSTEAPRLGRASVTLRFDNSDGRIPLEFQEISLSRKIFRDGLNEYYINDSQVRLKDIVELMARVGLGESKHNIIGQGEVDRMLLSSSRERREMLEEALGLRIYQIKKNESLRKLDQTETNMQQVQLLVRELTPHLKFLRTQAQKMQQRELVEKELAIFQTIYLLRERKEIEQQKSRLHVDMAPLVEKRAKIQEEMKRMNAEIAEFERVLASVMVKTEEEKKLLEFEQKRRELERELGRLEGRLETERQRISQPKIRVVDLRYIKTEIQEFLAEMRGLLEGEESVEDAREHMMVLVEDLENLLNKIDRGTTEETREESEWQMVRSLEQSIKSLQEEMASASARFAHLETARIEQRERYRDLQQNIKQLDTTARALQEEERDLSLTLQRYSFEEERVHAREQAYVREAHGFTLVSLEEIAEYLHEYGSILNEDLRKKIERMRARLEEIGGIDAQAFKEYQEMETRHAFLVKELDDLAQASASLKELVKELDKHVKEDFSAGFAKIKEEFHNFFRIIFGGGKATLELVQVPARGKESEEGEEAEAGEHQQTDIGVDISVDLPRKRIRGLAMLSGGERALTSIALLFAITAVNPPPFLILDETDAALDEANSQRYSAIIGELAKKTQLLLITHNRETMKSASILYGVTMGQDGVSKLLSLKLDQAEVYTNR
ncbi:MAG: AAA family ATPase [bacterium]|nr:AAA family ATPase [bacterium]